MWRTKETTESVKTLLVSFGGSQEECSFETESGLHTESENCDRFKNDRNRRMIREWNDSWIGTLDRLLTLVVLLSPLAIIDYQQGFLASVIQTGFIIVVHLSLVVFNNRRWLLFGFTTSFTRFRIALWMRLISVCIWILVLMFLKPYKNETHAQCSSIWRDRGCWFYISGIAMSLKESAALVTSLIWIYYDRSERKTHPRSFAYSVLSYFYCSFTTIDSDVLRAFNFPQRSDDLAADENIVPSVVIKNLDRASKWMNECKQKYWPSWMIDNESLIYFLLSTLTAMITALYSAVVMESKGNQKGRTVGLYWLVSLMSALSSLVLIVAMLGWLKNISFAVLIKGVMLGIKCFMTVRSETSLEGTRLIWSLLSSVSAIILSVITSTFNVRSKSKPGSQTWFARILHNPRIIPSEQRRSVLVWSIGLQWWLTQMSVAFLLMCANLIAPHRNLSWLNFLRILIEQMQYIVPCKLLNYSWKRMWIHSDPEKCLSQLNFAVRMLLIALWFAFFSSFWAIHRLSIVWGQLHSISLWLGAILPLCSMLNLTVMLGCLSHIL